jgi:polar amino acid transport system substrate-binding protein
VRYASLALAAAAAVVAPAAAAPPTKVRGQLRVALSLPSPGLQAGSVRGREVVLAKGLEPELVRALAHRLGIARRHVHFVNESLFSRLYAPGAKDWDLAAAAVTITTKRRRQVDFSIPYLKADQGVLARPGLFPIPRTLADLRGAQLCSERATTGGALIVSRLKPSKKPLLLQTPTALLNSLQSRRCDAAVYDLPVLAIARAQSPDRYGPLVGRIATGEQYGLVFQKRSDLRKPVNVALKTLIANGTVATLARRWLSVDPNAVPVLR